MIKKIQTPQDCLEVATELLNWDGKIPKEIVHSGKFKVRNNWFQGIYSCLDITDKLNLLPDSINREYLDFSNYYENNYEKEEMRKNLIEKGTYLLKKVVDHLGEKN